MRKLVLAAVLVAGAAALSTAALGATRGTSGVARAASPDAAPVRCSKAEIGGMFPLTGPAPGIGDEQRNWAVLGLAQTNRKQHTRYKMVQGDTMLSASEAATVATRMNANANIVAVVGPAGSQEVLNSAPIFKRGGMGFISSSATRTTLTVSTPDQPRQTPVGIFFRDVPNDDIQGPTIGQYVRKKLKAKRVVVIDDQTSYGVPLADGVSKYLRSHGASSVTRKSVPRSQTDFSALVTSIPSNTQVVVLLWQVAQNATIFSRQMREQGKNAKVFGSDGLFDPSAFTVEGAYVSIFAPVLPKNNPFAKAYTRRFHKEFGSFGPPAYLAAQIVATAIKRSCGNGTTSRVEVRKFIRRTNIKKSLLGGRFQFKANGDPKGAHFYIYKIVRGKYKRVF